MVKFSLNISGNSFYLTRQLRGYLFSRYTIGVNDLFTIGYRRHKKWEAHELPKSTFILELSPFHSPLQVQIIANQLPILVESSGCAGPSVDSLLVGWRAILVPSNASILWEVEEQHVFLRFCAGALFQLRQSWTRASRHFTSKLNKNSSRNEEAIENLSFLKWKILGSIDNFLLLRNFNFPSS
jgi:hypothetical protein